MASFGYKNLVDLLKKIRKEEEILLSLQTIASMSFPTIIADLLEVKEAIRPLMDQEEYKELAMACLFKIQMRKTTEKVKARIEAEEAEKKENQKEETEKENRKRKISETDGKDLTVKKRKADQEKLQAFVVQLFA